MQCVRSFLRAYFTRSYSLSLSQRRPLEQVILKVKLLELGDPCGVLKLALQPPDVSDIKRTIMTLKEVSGFYMLL